MKRVSLIEGEITDKERNVDRDGGTLPDFIEEYWTLGGRRHIPREKKNLKIILNSS